MQAKTNSLNSHQTHQFEGNASHDELSFHVILLTHTILKVKKPWRIARYCGVCVRDTGLKVMQATTN